MYIIIPENAVHNLIQLYYTVITVKFVVRYFCMTAKLNNYVKNMIS